MGEFLEKLGMEAGTQAASSVLAPLGQELGYWVGELTGSRRRQEEQSLDYQNRLMGLQEQYSQRAADYGQGLQKDYAQFAQGLQKDMFDYTAKYNSPEQQVARLKKAGLNVGLALGGGAAGAGGSTGSVSGAGAGVTAPQGGADYAMQRKMAAIQEQQLGLQMARQRAEIKNINADTANKEANTILVGEETKLTGQQINSEAYKAWLLGAEVFAKKIDLHLSQFDVEDIANGKIDKFQESYDGVLYTFEPKSIATQKFNAEAISEITEAAIKEMDLNISEEQYNILVEKKKAQKEAIMGLNEITEFFKKIGMNETGIKKWFAMAMVALAGFAKNSLLKD